MSLSSLLLFSLVWSSGAVLFALAAERMMPDPQDRIWLWRAVLFMCAVPLVGAGLNAMGVRLPTPDLPVWVEFGEGGEAAGPGLGTVTDTVSLQAALTLDDMVIALVVLAWALVAARSAVGALRVRRTVAKAKSATAQMNGRVAYWARETGLPRVPDLRISEDGAPAFTAGSVIVVPEEATRELTSRELDQVIAHECMHVRRGDLVTRPLERLIADAMAFLPPVWLVRSCLDALREEACDVQTIALTKAPKSYASALLKSALFGRADMTLAASPFPSARRNEMAKRIEAALSAEGRRRAPLALGLAALALAVAAPMGVAQTLGTPLAKAVEYTSAVFPSGANKVTSKFGKRISPITNEQQLHRGVDVSAPLGTPIYAPTGGTVIYAGDMGNYGNVVELKVSDSTVLRFAQMDAVSVAVGDEIASGTSVGTVGMSGLSTGPHLHLEVMVDGEPVDPQAQSGLVLFEVE